MNELLQKLMALFSQQKPPAPVPSDPRLETAPWEIPQSTPAPVGARPSPPASTPITPTPGGQPELPPMAEEALLQALRRKQMNQAFAGGTGNPMPQ